MRFHPQNSPHAAARIVVLTLLADGHLSRTELNALLREDVATQLGLASAQMDPLVQEVSEDLLATGFGSWSNGQPLDLAVVAGALSEVDDPVLRERTLAQCVSAARADGHVSEGEQAMLAEAARRWSLHACLIA
jgi:hypothetical protein